MRGHVLLQNKGNASDLNRAKILVVGENAIKMMTVGGGSSSLKVQREFSPDGISVAGKAEVVCSWLRAMQAVNTTGGDRTELKDDRTPEEPIAVKEARCRLCHLHGG